MPNKNKKFRRNISRSDRPSATPSTFNVASNPTTQPASAAGTPTPLVSPRLAATGPMPSARPDFTMLTEMKMISLVTGIVLVVLIGLYFALR